MYRKEVGRARKLKQIRSALGKSQMTIANDLGCPNSRICYYEQGIMEPTQEELERICALYGVNKDWLFGNSKEMFVGVIMNGKKEVAERLKELRKESGMTLS